MSTNTLTRTAQREHDERVSSLVSVHGLPQWTTDERDAHLKAIGGAAADSLADVLREHGPALYKDPSAAESDGSAFRDASKRLAADVERMRLVAVFIIRNARKVDPKATLLDIGLAVENVDRTAVDQTTVKTLGARWARYGLAVDLVALSRESVAAGKRTSAISETHALAAADRSTPRGELRRMAKEGLTLPTSDVTPANATDPDAPEVVRTYKAPAILNALNSAIDRAKHFDKSTMTAAQVADIAAAFKRLEAAIAGVKPAPAETPAPSSEERKSVPTPKDVHAA